jgi:hypothetical protein
LITIRFTTAYYQRAVLSEYALPRELQQAIEGVNREALRRWGIDHLNEAQLRELYVQFVGGRVCVTEDRVFVSREIARRLARAQF